ncbi:MAG: hypothetical protein QM689_06870 [Oscillospiraceae bacterium]
MKKISIIFMLVVFLVLAGCDSQRENSSETVTVGSHMNVLTGKIVEIKDGNVIRIEITKERGGFQVEDQVLLQYRTFSYVFNDAEGKVLAKEPTLNDEVSAQFWPSNVSQKDGYAYIEDATVDKFVDE